jgi:hypothetical protein
MRVEVVDAERVSLCSFFCSFDTCGQYVKKSGRIILVAFLAI